MTETYRVRDLAAMVAKIAGAEISYVDNPRAEADENELDVENRRLLDMGLTPITLGDGLLSEIVKVSRKFKDRCDTSKIPCTSKMAQVLRLGPDRAQYSKNDESLIKQARWYRDFHCNPDVQPL